MSEKAPSPKKRAPNSPQGDDNTISHLEKKILKQIWLEKIHC